VGDQNGFRGVKGSEPCGGMERKRKRKRDSMHDWARGKKQAGGTHRCIFSSIKVKPHLEGKREVVG
jgi:hypothetical protein